MLNKCKTRTLYTTLQLKKLSEYASVCDWSETFALGFEEVDFHGKIEQTKHTLNTSILQLKQLYRLNK